jgi:hypothetical protein
MWPLVVTVLDTTFNISSPIPNVTITAPGQSGTASVTLLGTDNFFGPINVSLHAARCHDRSDLPSPRPRISMSSSVTVSAPLTITTTAPHQVGCGPARQHVGLLWLRGAGWRFPVHDPSARTRGMRRRRTAARAASPRRRCLDRQLRRWEQQRASSTKGPRNAGRNLHGECDGNLLGNHADGQLQRQLCSDSWRTATHRHAQHSSNRQP